MTTCALHVFPVHPRGFLVQWSLTAPVVGDYAFAVARSGGPEGPWEELVDGLTNTYAWFDALPQPSATDPETYTRSNQFRLFGTWYYRVTATAPGGAVTGVFEVGPEASGYLAGQRRKLARDVRIALERYTGHRAALLKRRTWGARCPLCFDPKTKAVTRGGCKTCWGTSFVDGYWAPTLVYVRRGAESEAKEGGPSTLQLADVPRVNEGDILVFLEDNRRWRIGARNETKLRLEAAYQTMNAELLGADDVIYAYRVDPGTVAPLF